MRMHVWVGAALLAAVPLAVGAQVRVELPAPSGRVNVTFTEPSDEGQADRLRDLAVRLKPIADQLETFDQIDIVVVHSQRELDQRLGPGQAGALTGVSYVHGILFLSPLTWQRNPTDEALDHEMQEALARYAVVRLAGGNRVPDWLEEGLVSVLTRRPVAPITAEQVARRADLLLAQFEAADPAVGHWAVRYLVDERGGRPAAATAAAKSAHRARPPSSAPPSDPRRGQQLRIEPAADRRAGRPARQSSAPPDVG